MQKTMIWVFFFLNFILLSIMDFPNSNTSAMDVLAVAVVLILINVVVARLYRTMTN